MEEVHRLCRRKTPWADGTSRPSTDEPGSQEQQVCQGKYI